MNSTEKKNFYEKATLNLLTQLAKFGLSDDARNNAVYYTRLFRAAFKIDELKQFVFVDDKNTIWDLGYDSAGFCRISSSIFSIALGIRDWKLMRIDPDQWIGKASHHYIQHIPSGMFFDLTYDQFAIDGLTVPYDIGKPATYGLYPKNDTMRFADALDIDIIGMLKQSPKRQ